MKSGHPVFNSLANLFFERVPILFWIVNYLDPCSGMISFDQFPLCQVPFVNKLMTYCLPKLTLRGFGFSQVNSLGKLGLAYKRKNQAPAAAPPASGPS